MNALSLSTQPTHPPPHAHTRPAPTHTIPASGKLAPGPRSQQSIPALTRILLDSSAIGGRGRKGSRRHFLSLVSWSRRIRRLKTPGEIGGCWAAGVEVLALLLTVLVERSVIFGGRTTKLVKALGTFDAHAGLTSQSHVGSFCVFASMPITWDGYCWWSMASVLCCVKRQIQISHLPLLTPCLSLVCLSKGFVMSF